MLVRHLLMPGMVEDAKATLDFLGSLDVALPIRVITNYEPMHEAADHPVIVHFASAEQAFTWAREVPDSARALAQRFWPGPLTLILKRASRAPDFITGGQDNVGVRVPSHRCSEE